MRMSRGLAPIALRTPISRVRSVTEASRTFMMPIPPTSREIPVIAPMNSLKMKMPSVACASRCVDVCTSMRPSQRPKRCATQSSTLLFATSTSSRRRAFTSNTGVRGAVVGGSTVDAAANGTYRLSVRSPLYGARTPMTSRGLPLTRTVRPIIDDGERPAASSVASLLESTTTAELREASAGEK